METLALIVAIIIVTVPELRAAVRAAWRRLGFTTGSRRTVQRDTTNDQNDQTNQVVEIM